ncbi:hypothetical protein [Deinococcus aestuarii]|uniref:hypothetical protein n=1 Tax=Deinococcus aestuarii TaxID=2774531 RepID=UPI001C0B7764|nr:hypothetical protein [Deinococcus aestuarii]
MAYKKLSEQLQELNNPQRSDTFVKLFREAVREGKFEAAQLSERFTIPKQFRRRGAEDTYQRDTREMLFEVTPEFERWFEQTNQDLAASPSRGSGKVRPSLEAIESGQLDFKALAEETRRRLQSSFEKGQTLGKSRAATRGAAKAQPKGRGKAKAARAART